MMKVLTQFTLMLSVSTFVLGINGCANESYEQCKSEASNLWDPMQGGNPHKNDAYWAAIKKCKEKYNQ